MNVGERVEVDLERAQGLLTHGYGFLGGRRGGISEISDPRFAFVVFDGEMQAREVDQWFLRPVSAVDLLAELA